MKNLLFSVTAALLLLPGTGCKTLPPCAENPDSAECTAAESARIGRITESLAFTGGVLALRDNPEWRVPLDLASTELGKLAEKDTITLADIYEALQPLPFAEIHSPEASLIVGNGQILLEEIGAGELDLTKVSKLKAAAAGLSKGIQRALSS